MKLVHYYLVSLRKQGLQIILSLIGVAYSRASTGVLYATISAFSVNLAPHSTYRQIVRQNARTKSLRYIRVYLRTKSSLIGPPYLTKQPLPITLRSMPQQSVPLLSSP